MAWPARGRSSTVECTEHGALAGAGRGALLRAHGGCFRPRGARTPPGLPHAPNARPLRRSRVLDRHDPRPPPPDARGPGMAPHGVRRARRARRLPPSCSTSARAPGARARSSSPPEASLLLAGLRGDRPAARGPPRADRSCRPSASASFSSRSFSSRGRRRGETPPHAGDDRPPHGTPEPRGLRRARPRRARARRADRPRLALAMLDLDHFKSFNDRTGIRPGTPLSPPSPARSPGRSAASTSRAGTAARSSSSSSSRPTTRRPRRAARASSHGRRGARAAPRRPADHDLGRRRGPPGPLRADVVRGTRRAGGRRPLRREEGRPRPRDGRGARAGPRHLGRPLPLNGVSGSPEAPERLLDAVERRRERDPHAAVLAEGDARRHGDGDRLEKRLREAL